MGSVFNDAVEMTMSTVLLAISAGILFGALLGAIASAI